MDPHKVAKLIMNKVKKYCHDTDEYIDVDNFDPYLECLWDHRPCELKYFINKYLPEKVTKELSKTVRNVDKLWDDVKNEYDKLWDKEVGLEVGEELGDQLESFYRDIMLFDLDELDEEEKAEYLKDYADYLEEFADDIDRALKEKKPLSKYDLYDWYWAIGHKVFGESKGYDDLIEYYTSFYNTLGDTAKLDVLKMLLHTIHTVLSYIYEDLKVLGTLTNKS